MTPPPWIPEDLLEPLALLVVDPLLGGAVLQDEAAAVAQELARALQHSRRALGDGPAPFVANDSAPLVELGPPFTLEALEDQVDWSASLKAGRKVWTPGVWEKARGGVLFIHRAEDLDLTEQAWLAQRLDAAGNPPQHPLVVACLSGSLHAPAVSALTKPPASPGFPDPLNPGRWPTGAFARVSLTALETRLALRLGTRRVLNEEQRLAHLQELLPAGEAIDLVPGHRHSKQQWELWNPEALARARAHLPRVEVDPTSLRHLCQAAAAMGVANPALEVLALRVAKARAALHGRRHLVEDDLQRAIQWVLAPRRAQDDSGTQRAPHQAGTSSSRAPSGEGAPSEPTPSRAGQLEMAQRRASLGEASLAERHPVAGRTEKAGRAQKGTPAGQGQPHRRADADRLPGPVPSAGLAQLETAARELRLGELNRWLAPLSSRTQNTSSRASTRHATASGPDGSRRSYRSRPQRLPSRGTEGRSASNPSAVRIGPPGSPGGARLALAATLAAALPWQPFRRRPEGVALSLRVEDLRWYPPRPDGGTLFVLVVDTSGSMGRIRVRSAQNLALGLLRKAYLQRDHVALVRCSGLKPALLMPPGRSSNAARRTLESLPVGGGTPLPEALALAAELARRYRRRHPQREVVITLLTDGRANVAWGHAGHPQPPASAEAAIAEEAAIPEQLAALGRALKESGVTVAVMDRDRPGLPADDARNLAALLGAAFIPL